LAVSLWFDLLKGNDIRAKDYRPLAKDRNSLWSLAVRLWYDLLKGNDIRAKD
jgi:hypothetical protein